MKATITITDNPDGKSCNVELAFDPPLKRLAPGEEMSPARKSVEIAFAAMRDAASNIKATEIYSRS